MNTKQFIALLAFIFAVIALFSFRSEEAETQYEFTNITIIESIVPSGLGRSRIIEAKDKRDHLMFTKLMSADDKSRNKSDRSEIRVEQYEETKILNFYNVGGIRFQNIAANDAVVQSKVNEKLAQGWKIVSINSGVEAYSGVDDGDGLYLTRIYFQRELK